VTKVISPAERSGSLVGFDVARYQAVTGKLFVREGGQRRPMEFLEIRARSGDRAQAAPTGKDGEFFLENVGSGIVDLLFRDRGRDRSCAIVVPESEEIIVEVGEVSCEFFP
jgi:outer membrane usher protein FimD/PapC